MSVCSSSPASRCSFESDSSIRASILNVCIQLGALDDNSRIAHWIFHDAADPDYASYFDDSSMAERGRGRGKRRIRFNAPGAGDEGDNEEGGNMRFAEEATYQRGQGAAAARAGDGGYASTSLSSKLAAKFGFSKGWRSRSKERAATKNEVVATNEFGVAAPANRTSSRPQQLQLRSSDSENRRSFFGRISRSGSAGEGSESEASPVQKLHSPLHRFARRQKSSSRDVVGPTSPTIPRQSRTPFEADAWEEISTPTPMEYEDNVFMGKGTRKLQRPPLAMYSSSSNIRNRNNSTAGGGSNRDAAPIATTIRTDVVANTNNRVAAAHASPVNVNINGATNTSSASLTNAHVTPKKPSSVWVNRQLAKSPSTSRDSLGSIPSTPVRPFVRKDSATSSGGSSFSLRGSITVGKRASPVPLKSAISGPVLLGAATTAGLLATPSPVKKQGSSNLKSAIKSPTTSFSKIPVATKSPLPISPISKNGHKLRIKPKKIGGKRKGAVTDTELTSDAETVQLQSDVDDNGSVKSRFSLSSIQSRMGGDRKKVSKGGKANWDESSHKGELGHVASSTANNVGAPSSFRGPQPSNTVPFPKLVRSTSAA